MPITDQQRKKIDLFHARIARTQRHLQSVSAEYMLKRSALESDLAAALAGLSAHYDTRMRPIRDKIQRIQDDLAAYLDTLPEDV